MRIPVRQLLRSLPLLLAVCVTVVSACDEQDPFIVPDRSPLDIWRDDVQFVDATNVPQAQIDRFVAANNMDTLVTETGLVYQLDDPGGAERPSVGDSVTVDYRGYLVDGRIFDQTTVQGPAEFPLTNLIDAWKEGIPLMGRGGRMWMVVRPSLGYGTGGNPRAGISGSSVIVFEIELVDFVDLTP